MIDLLSVFSLQIVNTAQTVQVDLAEIVAPATHSVYVVQIHLSQLTEVGDAAEEMLLILAKTGATTSGSGGNTVTPVPQNLGATAFGGTCESHNTTKATTGTIVTHGHWNWNVRMPFDPIILPDTAFRIAPSERWTLELATTPADSITLGGFIKFGIL